MKKVLIVEDSLGIVELISHLLRQDGFLIDFAYDGRDALKKIATSYYDLIVLDVVLPSVNGFEICSVLRAKDTITKVLMLSGRDSIEDKVKGFALGINDYITKPFAIEEFRARVRNLTRSDSLIYYGDIVVDKTARLIIHEKNIVEFRKKEFELLMFMLTNVNKVLSRDEIIDSVWNYESVPYLNTIDVHIRRLRKKLENKIQKVIIETVHGVGYKLLIDNL